MLKEFLYGIVLIFLPVVTFLGFLWYFLDTLNPWIFLLLPFLVIGEILSGSYLIDMVFCVRD